MIKLCAKTNTLHNFAWLYVILSNLSSVIFTAMNHFSHFSRIVSIFGKMFSYPSFIPFNAKTLGVTHEQAGVSDKVFGGLLLCGGRGSRFGNQIAGSCTNCFL
jgi:hypothetical protein